jgi:hypothetical protein
MLFVPAIVVLVVMLYLRGRHSKFRHSSRRRNHG